MPDRLAGAGIIENLIVGTGLGAIATAMALRDCNKPYEVLDVGFDLDPAKAKQVTELAAQTPDQWDDAARLSLYPPPAASARGIERRLLFGSDFPYRNPELLSVRYEDCTTELSHGFGGFGNVWGAAMLPYGSHNFRHWPVPPGDMDRSYRNVLRYVPLAAETDRLAVEVPLHVGAPSALARSRQTRALMDALEKRSEALARAGISFGRARLAVDASRNAGGCRYCGMCLGGCVYGAIFNPRLLFRQIEQSGTKIHRGHCAMEFAETGKHVTLTTASPDGHGVRQWKARRVFLATGHFATTNIIARSLRRFNEPIRIQDSQYFFFPLISYRAQQEPIRFALAEIFLEMLNPDISNDYLHFQLYGLNDIFLHALRGMIPPPMPVTSIAGRFYMIQGYLPSSDSGHLELIVEPSASSAVRLTIRGSANPRARTVARNAQRLLRRHLLSFGIIPPAYLQLVPPGRSFHTGGSFPMGGTHAIYASDVLGRPAGLKRVHIVDSANFPAIAGSTIGFTIMANADRIVRKLASELDS
jgi:ferredoxin